MTNEVRVTGPVTAVRTQRVTGSATDASESRVPMSGAFPATIGNDTWTRSWGGAWARSWYMAATAIAASPAVSVTDRVTANPSAANTLRVSGVPTALIQSRL